jgi:antitoxin component YwqK of YwqJK toxin-antitoxin module
MKNLIIPFIFLLSATLAHAQNATTKSLDIIKKGVELHDKGEYKKALELYRQVPADDSNYSLALYEEVNTLLADSTYAEAKTKALKGVQFADANKRRYLLALANAYDYLQQHDSAMYYYYILIKLNPHDYQPYYEIGASYYLQDKYDSSMFWYQQALLHNPYHFRSHFMLGNLYMLKGRLAEAMICFEMSLCCTKDIEFAKKSVRMILAITEETDEVNKYYDNRDKKKMHPMFEDINQLVNAKVVMTKKYKLQSSVDDKSFRQTQLIMEKLKYDENDSDFVMQFYVPLLVKVYEKEMFEPFLLNLYSGYNVGDDINKAAKKKKGKVMEVRDIVEEYLNKIGRTRVLNYKKRLSSEERYFSFSDNDAFVVGKFQDVSKGIPDTGYVEIYHYDMLSMTGVYNKQGYKQGTWNWYYPSGALNIVQYFNNGQQDGERTEYHKNGKVASSIPYSDDKVKDGIYKEYYDNGAVKTEAQFKNGTLNGVYKTYTLEGKLEEEKEYKDGNVVEKKK